MAKTAREKPSNLKTRSTISIAAAVAIVVAIVIFTRSRMEACRHES